MTDPIGASKLPPVLKKGKSKPAVFLRIGLLIVVIVFVTAKVKQHENKSKSPVTSFLLSGEQGTKFSFSVTTATGESKNVTTQIWKQKQKVLTTDKLEILSCKLERLEGEGAISLEILVDTNLMATVELPAGKQVVELKRDHWSSVER